MGNRRKTITDECYITQVILYVISIVSANVLTTEFELTQIGILLVLIWEAMPYVVVGQRTVKIVQFLAVGIMQGFDHSPSSSEEDWRP